MKVFSANLMNPADGELLTLRWVGTETEIAHWQRHGLVPLNAEEVLSIDVLTDAALAMVEFDLLPVAGRVLQ